MFRLFVYSGVVIVLALFTALIAPHFIDWTAYKQEFERQASQITGQPVRVDGEASVRILPLPSVTFTDVSVGETPEGGALMKAERFSANVELAPLLSGQIRVVDMHLERPHFDIAVDESGRIAWTERRQMLVDPGQVKLDRLTVRRATFVLSGLAGGRSVTGDQISADLSAASLYGPWRIDGSGLVEGRQTRFEMATGRLTDANTIRLRIAAVQDGFAYEVRGDGPVSLREQVLSWNGEFETLPAGRSTNDELRGVHGGESGLPVWTRGRFTLEPAQLLLPEIVIEIGPRDDPFVLNGEGLADLRGDGGFRLELDGRQIDVERIARMRGEEPAEAPSIESRIALLRGILDQVPIPAINGVLDFEIPAIVSGDKMIREISMAVRPQVTRWQVDRMKAVLPGNTVLEFRGSVGRGDDFGVDGDLVVASRQPSGLAVWLGGDPGPLIRRMSSAGLSARVSASLSQIDLNGMEIALGGNSITGRLNRLSPVAGIEDKASKPAILAELNGEVIELDDLRALARMVGQEDIAAGTHDYDVTMKAGRLTGFGLEAEGVDVKFQVRNGEISVSRLDAERFLGASVKSTGQIRDLLSDARGNLKLALAAPTLAPLASEFARRVGENALVQTLASDPALSADTDLTIELDAGAAGSGSASRNRYVVAGKSGGTRLSITGGFDGGIRSLLSDGVQVSLQADNADSEMLLRQAGLERFGFAPVPGTLASPLRLNFEFLGSRDEGYSTSLTASAPGNALTVQGMIRPVAGKPAVFDIDATFGSHDLSPLVVAFGHSLPGVGILSGESLPFSANATLSRGDSQAIAARIAGGQVAGNRFNGDLTIDAAPDGDRLVTGALRIDHVDLPWLFAAAFGLAGDPVGQADETGGGALLSASEFDGPAFPGLDLRLDLQAQTAGLGAGDPASSVAASLLLDDGSLRINGAKGEWAGGSLAGSVSLSGSEDLALQVQFEAGDLGIASLMAAAGLPPVLDGRLSASGTLEGIGRSPLAIAGALGGNGVVSVAEGRMEGIRQEGLAEILAAADADGFSIDAATVDPLARAALGQGTTAFSLDSAPFSVSRGVVTLRNAELDTPAETDPDGHVAVDVASGEIDAGLTVAPPAGREALAGASTEVTFSWQGRPGSLASGIDTAPLQGFLSLRAFEIEQRRVEILQAAIVERQRLRSDLLRSDLRQRRIAEEAEAQRLREEAERERLRLEQEREAERLRQEEAERQRILEEQRAAEEAARLEAERLAEEERKAEEARRAEEERRAQEAQRLAEQAERREIKSGIEAQPLPPPEAPPSGSSSGEQSGQPPVIRGLFDNIERLLLDGGR